MVNLTTEKNGVILIPAGEAREAVERGTRPLTGRATTRLDAAVQAERTKDEASAGAGARRPSSGH